MAYKPKDPDRPINTSPPTQAPAPLTPEESEALAAGEQGATLAAAIRKLRGPILEAQATEAAAAEDRVKGHQRTQILRGIGKELRAAAKAHETRLRKIARDPDLSPEGRTRAELAAREPLEKTIGKLAENGLGKNADALLADFPEPSPWAPSPELVAEAGLVYDSFPYKSSAGFLIEAIGHVRRATTASTPNAEKFRANGLLASAYGPLVRRRTESPERFARHLQPLYAEANTLIEIHLNTTQRTHAHTVAIELVSQARQDFDFLLGMLRSHQHRWDPTFEVGAPFFNWDK